MTDTEDRLLGYLMNDCDAREREAVERLIKNSADVARRLQAVRRKYALLLAGFEEVAPPAGLAAAVCGELFFEEAAPAQRREEQPEFAVVERRSRRVTHA
jgi:anti-sigma-K factor RskA